MIIRINVACPNCGFLTLSIPDKSDFYFTSCDICKERCIYLTKEKEKEFKKLVSKMSNDLFEEWLKQCKENNIKIKYI